MKISLTLFICGKQKTIEVEYDDSKNSLDLYGRNITSVKGTVFPPNITTLNISKNQIKSLEGLPPTLTTLVIPNNQIKSLEGLPPNLAYFNISSNQITSLEGLPPNLTKLYISDNQITSLEGLPQNLTELYIPFNRIESLEGLPPSLATLNISYNRIKSLKGLPPNLIELYISGNQITSFEGLPPNLTYLDICDNQITSLPIEIVHMRNLREFHYSGNPIENIHPSVQRFLTSLRNRDTSRGNTIYDDGQNVHNEVVQSSIRESLNFLTRYEQLVTESKLPSEEISFLDEQEVHSYFHFTQKEVLLFVENAIEVGGYSTSVKEELYSLLKEALREGRSVCSTGRIGRMVNVLSGFDPNVQIKISDKAQIGAIVSSFRERNESKEKVEEELIARGLKKEEIDEWLEYY